MMRRKRRPTDSCELSWMFPHLRSVPHALHRSTDCAIIFSCTIPHLIATPTIVPRRVLPSLRVVSPDFPGFRQSLDWDLHLLSVDSRGGEVPTRAPEARKHPPVRTAHRRYQCSTHASALALRCCPHLPSPHGTSIQGKVSPQAANLHPDLHRLGRRSAEIHLGSPRQGVRSSQRGRPRGL